jgi:hypothetical protein
MLSTLIHRCANYSACTIRTPKEEITLTVTRNCGAGGGVHITDPREAAHWSQMIKTALDSTEAAAYCRAVLAA